jgi:Glycosyl transferase family 2
VVLSYSHPAGVNHPTGTLLLVPPAGAAVAIDAPLLRPWTAANGRTLILVDNGGVLSGATLTGPVPIRVLLRKRRASYPAALNHGVAAARESFLLLLNADVRLDPAALGYMLERGTDDPRIAAVAPKLLLWRTPRFLNGLGNAVLTSTLTRHYYGPLIRAGRTRPCPRFLPHHRLQPTEFNRCRPLAGSSRFSFRFTTTTVPGSETSRSHARAPSSSIVSAA